MLAQNQISEQLRKYGPDIAALAGIAVLNALVFYTLPQNLQLELMLNRQSPELLSWWTHAFVHNGQAHLQSNLEGYALTALPAWVLYVYEGQRRRFWFTATIFLTLGPVITAVASNLIYSSVGWTIRYSMGFSAVVSAFGGFLLGSTLTEIELVQPKPLARTTAGYLLSILLLTMAVTLSGPVLSLLFGVSGVLTMVCLSYLTSFGSAVTVLELGRWAKQNPTPAILIGVGGLFGAASVLTAFPNTIVQDGTLVDFAGHGSGLIFGLASSYVGRPLS